MSGVAVAPSPSAVGATHVTAPPTVCKTFKLVPEGASWLAVSDPPNVLSKTLAGVNVRSGVVVPAETTIALFAAVTAVTVPLNVGLATGALDVSVGCT